MVWIGGSVSTYESQVFYYHLIGLGPSQVTDSEIAKRNLDISGDKFAWDGTTDILDDQTREIYFFDLMAPGIVQITDNEVSDIVPKISGDKMVWSRRNVDVYLSNRVYYYDLSAVGEGTPMMLMNNGKAYYNPSIDGNRIACYHADGSDSEVVYYDINVPAPPVQLTSTNAFVYGIQLSDNKVWWQGWHGDIHYYDPGNTANPVLIHDVDPNGWSLYLNATDDYAAWSKFDGTSIRDIYYYDLNGQMSPIQLTDDNAWDVSPIIVGDYIVWQKGEDNDAEIYYYNLSTQGPIVRLTDNDFEDNGSSLRASGNTIVWHGGYVGEEETYEIFTATLPGMPSASRDLDAVQHQLNTISPNPVADQATIEFTIANKAQVSLQVLDVNGKAIDVLIDEIMPEGQHQAVFEVGHLPAGIYFVRLKADNTSISRRLAIVK